MLHKLLSSIGTKNVATLKELAAELDVSTAVLDQLVDELVARGYLASTARCDSPCAGCSARGACHFDRDPRLWTLTAKGARAIRNP